MDASERIETAQLSIRGRRSEGVGKIIHRGGGGAWNVGGPLTEHRRIMCGLRRACRPIRDDPPIEKAHERRVSV